MKRLIYLSLAALTVLAVSCKKDSHGKEPKVQEPSVKTLAADEIKVHSARLNASIDFGDVEWLGVNYGFYWGTSEDQEGTYIQGEGNLIESGPYSAVITGLAPETEYWYKAFVEIDDRSYTGEILTFTTEEGIPDNAIDLGLGVRWATCNLDENGFVSSPDRYGAYFAWGETETKSNYDWSTYKWCQDGQWNKITKYIVNSGYGIVDNITELERGDDVASKLLGGKWRMPTNAELTDLREKCNWVWTDNYNNTGTAGRIVTSKSNSNSIFLPAAGYMDGTSLSNPGSSGRYSSCSLDPTFTLYGRYLFFDSGYVYSRDESRYFGLSVRPVYKE